MSKKKLITLFITTLIITIPAFLRAEVPEELNKRGVELGKQKDYDGATREFKKAVTIYNNKSAQALHNLAWVLELKGNITEAIKNYEEAIRRNPSQLQSYKRLGYLYFKTGEFEKAVEIGELLLREEPGNNEVLKWLPEAYARKLKKHQETLLAKRREKAKKSEEREGEEKSEEIMPKEGEPERKSRARAQDILLKIGYIPAYRTTFEKYSGTTVENVELHGFTLQAENNLYYRGIWFGIGFEWQRMERKETEGYYLYNYLMPLLTIKHLHSSGLYYGIGLSGKYLLTIANPDSAPLEAKKEIDLWAHILIGVYLPINKTVYFCFENRAGWNITRKQFSEYENSVELDVKTSYECAFFLGIGMRIYHTENKKK